MKNLFIVVQSYKENTGSFYSFVEKIAREASSKYNVFILAGLEKNQKISQNPEIKSFAIVYRFKKLNIRILSIVNELFFAIKVFSFIKNHYREGDLIIANGYSALGVINKKYVIRAPDQPVFTYIKNVTLANTNVPIFIKLANLIQFLLFYPIDKIIMENSIGAIYSSTTNKNLNFKSYGVKKIPYFIPYKSVSIVEKTNILNREKDLLFITRDSEKIRKGAIYLEKILPSLFDRYETLHLIHVGDNISWNIPKKYLKKIISTGKVNRDKMNDYYQSCGCLVVCSLNEGMPSAIMEAMASKCPIVSSDIEGIEEFIPHMKSGYIYERGNTDELFKGICFILDNPNVSKKYAENAFLTAKKLSDHIYNEKLLGFVENAHKFKKCRLKINLLNDK